MISVSDIDAFDVRSLEREPFSHFYFVEHRKSFRILDFNHILIIWLRFAKNDSCYYIIIIIYL